MFHDNGTCLATIGNLLAAPQLMSCSYSVRIRSMYVCVCMYVQECTCACALGIEFFLDGVVSISNVYGSTPISHQNP